MRFYFFPPRIPAVLVTFGHLRSQSRFVGALGLSVYKNMCDYIRIFTFYVYVNMCAETKRKLTPIPLLRAGICTFSLDYFVPDTSLDLHFEFKKKNLIKLVFVSCCRVGVALATLLLRK